MDVEHGQEDRQFDPGFRGRDLDDPAVGGRKEGIDGRITVTIGVAEECRERRCKESQGECGCREACRGCGGRGDGARQYVR